MAVSCPSTESEASDRISTTSSVRDFPNIGFHSTEIEEAREYNPRKALHYGKGVLAGIGDHLPAHVSAPESLRNLDLTPTSIERTTRQEQQALLSRHYISNVPLEGGLDRAQRFWPTIPRNAMPFDPDGTIFTLAGPGRSSAHSEAGDERHLASLATQAVLPSVAKPLVSERPRVLNPLFILGHTRPGPNTWKCVACYTKPDSFIRAVFKEIEENTTALGISDASQIGEAKQESDRVRSTLAKVRKIWKCLFTHIMPLPTAYPVAAADHVCEVPRRRAKIRRQHERFSTVAPSDADTISTIVTSPHTQSLDKIAQSSELPQSSMLAISEHSRVFQQASNPAMLNVSFRAGQSDAQRHHMDDVLRRLRSLHHRAYGDRQDPQRLDKIKLLRNTIEHIRSFLHFAVNVMYSGPLPDRCIANIEDFLNWILPVPLPVDNREMEPQAHSDFIQDLEESLQQCLQRAHELPGSSQQAWRSSVIDISILRYHFILDEATKDMCSLKNTSGDSDNTTVVSGSVESHSTAPTSHNGVDQLNNK